MTNILADIVRIFHFLVVIFVILGPFTGKSYLLVLHITFSFSLLVHWHFNSNACSLTLLESQLRGIPVSSTFTHSLIAPVYDISATTWNEISYALTILLMLISLTNLLNSPEWNYCSKLVKTWPNGESKSILYKKCVTHLLS
jgi:hypothetical protein